jgi:hypothetical protein
MTKRYLLDAAQVKPLATGMGACYASDRITVEGRKVGFMYREEPDTDIDSGWRFTAGDESQEYMDDPDNVNVYDVNTIANYDSDIVPHLMSPAGSAFERDERTGRFQKVDFAPEED